MEVINERIVAIIYKKIAEGTLSPEESQELEAWAAGSELNRTTLEKLVMSEEALSEKAKKMLSIETSLYWEKIAQTTFPSAGLNVVPITQRLKRRRFLFAAAASVLVLIVVGGFWINSRMSEPGITKSEERYQNDIAPGGQKAVLTLGDGSTITLDDAADGAVATQGNTNVVKLQSGSLAYQSVKAGRGDKVFWNTITVPRGGQYKVILPDGSQVWLNAASSLRFPTAFDGKNRTVELIEGEGYFEIVKRSNQPFRVMINKGTGGEKQEPVTVEVLGTSFNVMAYNDETQIKTTLIEGSVRLSTSDAKTVLRPGQQVATSNEGLFTIMTGVDIDAEIAWKEGLFKFKRLKIDEVMNQVARWYDAEVHYEGPVTDVTFVAEIKRSENVSALLQLLEMTGRVEFRIEGKKIFVKSKKPTNSI